MTSRVHLQLNMCKTFSIAWIPVKAMGHRLSRGISGIIYVRILDSNAAWLFIYLFIPFINYFYVQSFANISVGGILN